MQLSAVVWACWKAPLFNMSIRRAGVHSSRDSTAFKPAASSQLPPVGNKFHPVPQRHPAGCPGGSAGASAPRRGGPVGPWYYYEITSRRGGSALRYHGLMHLFPFQHWSMAGPLVASMPPVLSFLGCKAIRGPLRFPSPLVTRGPVYKTAVKSTAYFFSVPF